MLKMLLFLVLFAWIFRFVLRFVLPVLKITSGVRKQMKNMQQQSRSSSYNAPPRTHKVREGDYIEYEEVK